MGAKTIDQERAEDEAKARAIRAAMTGEAAPADPAEMEEAELEAQAMAPQPPGRVTLGDGSVLVLAEPRAGDWMRALARLQAAMKPLAMALRMHQTGTLAELAETTDGRLMLAGYIMGALGEDTAETDKAVRSLMAALDALTGRPDGWAESLALDDAMAVLSGLVAVVKPERLRGFFVQAKGLAAMVVARAS